MADFSKSKIVKLVSGSKYQRLFSKDSGTRGIKLGHVILNPGEEIGEHSTENYEEALVILKGKGNLIIEKDDIIEIGEGHAMYIPPETIHNVKNTDKAILEYIFITSHAEKQ